MKNNKNNNNKTIHNKKDAQSMGKMAFKNFRRNPLSIIGCILFVLMILLVILAPVITMEQGQKPVLKAKQQAPTWYLNSKGLEQKDDAYHILGTDDVGRDMWTRLIYGGRNSMQVAGLSTIISLIIGCLVGSIAGYYGGKVDWILMRFTEVFQSFPYLPTMIVVSSALKDLIKSEHKMYLMAAIIGIFGWGGLARHIRAQLLSLREQEFIEAATALGISDTAKMFKHLLPNTLSTIIVTAMLRFAGGINSEVSLSYLGLGIAPPNPSWGNIIKYAEDTTHLKSHPWMWGPAIILVIITTVSINLLGEGLRDAFDPKSIR